MNEAVEAAARELRPAIAAAADKAVEQTIGLDVTDSVYITGKVTDEVAKVVVNQTNAEPWFQSRVTLFAIGGILTTLYVAGLDFADGTPPSVEVFSGYAMSLLTQGGVLYGRWIAKKPLGA